MKDKTFTQLQKRFLMGCMAILMVLPISATDIVTSFLNEAIIRAEKTYLVSDATDKAALSAAIATAITLKKNVTATQDVINYGIIVLNNVVDTFLDAGTSDSFTTGTAPTWGKNPNLSGTWLIANTAAHNGGYMSDIVANEKVGGDHDDFSLNASQDAYAFDITMNIDSTYTIKCGGAAIVSGKTNGWNVETEIGAYTKDSTQENRNWKFIPQANNSFFLKKSTIDQYVKVEINPTTVYGGSNTLWKYYDDKGTDVAEPFTLIPAVPSTIKDMLVLAITNSQTILTAGSGKADDAKKALSDAIAAATTVKNDAGSTAFTYNASVNALAAAVTDFDGVVTGVKESFASAVSVSPNPATDVIKVSNASSLSSVVIYSAIGQKVYDKAVTANEVNVSVSDWKSGVYVVTLISKNGAKKNVKVIVK